MSNPNSNYLRIADKSDFDTSSLRFLDDKKTGVVLFRALRPDEKILPDYGLVSNSVAEALKCGYEFDSAKNIA